MFHLKIVTPDKIFFDDEVKMLIVRGIEGDLAVMANTEPLVTPVKVSAIRIFDENDDETMAAISEGYLSIEPDKTVLVVEAAEWPEDIDIERAEESKARAEARLEKGSESTDLARARLSLNRAINRIEVGSDR